MLYDLADQLEALEVKQIVDEFEAAEARGEAEITPHEEVGGYKVYYRVNGAPAHEHHDHNHTSWPAETARSRNNPPSLRIKPGASLGAGDILQSHWR